jgi:hypothetical protein
MSGTVSVEVFKDVLYPSIDIVPIVEGVDAVGAITKNIELVRQGRSFSFADHKHNFLVVDELIFPEFDADINIIATGKYLYDAAYAKVLTPETCSKFSPFGGMALTYLRDKSSITRVALITSTEGRPPVRATTHELGHFFLELQGAGGHCPEPLCIMYPSEVTTSVPYQPKMTFSMSRSFTTGLTHQVVRNTKFCSDCTDHLRTGNLHDAITKQVS